MTQTCKLSKRDRCEWKDIMIMEPLIPEVDACDEHKATVMWMYAMMQNHRLEEWVDVHVVMTRGTTKSS